MVQEYIKTTSDTGNGFDTPSLESLENNNESEEFDEADIQKTKSWNFIKLHLQKHLFDDIQNKGVTHNFSTNPNEKMHGPLKKSYLQHSNFKDYSKQVRF